MDGEDQGKGISLRPMRVSDYDAALSLWKRCEGIGLSDADRPREIARFLERNPRSCFVAERSGAMVGTALCGSDGRRGYLYHLAVDSGLRRSGIGRRLVDACLDALRAEGIDKCHLFIFADNRNAAAFYSSTGWKRRGDLAVFSREAGPRG